MSKGSGKEKLTAKQRMEALELNALETEQRFGAVVQEFERLRGLIVSLGKRLNAAIEAGESGGISNDAVNKIMTDENAKQLKAQIDTLVANKYLEAAEDGLVSEDSFVVGREVDSERNVVNPRIQFSLTHLEDQAVKAKFVGQKVGSLVEPDSTENGELTIEITEVYNAVEQKAEVNSEELEKEAQETE